MHFQIAHQVVLSINKYYDMILYTILYYTTFSINKYEGLQFLLISAQPSEIDFSFSYVILDLRLNYTLKLQ